MNFHDSHRALEIAAKMFSQNDLQTAEGVLTKAIGLDPNNSGLLHFMGVVQNRKGAHEQAIQWVSKAISISPNNGQFHGNICEMYRQLGRLDLAMAHGKKAVECAPELGASYSNLGIVHYDRGELEQAEQCQLQALRIDPAFPQALNNLGSICRERKDKEGAVAYYKKVLSLNPNYIESLNNLGAVLTEQEKPEEAISPLLRALKLKPEYAESHRNLASAFLMLEDYPRADIGFTQALKYRPDFVEALLGKASIFQEVKNFAQAEEYIHRALEIDPSSTQGYTHLANLYNEMGYPEKAITLYQDAIDLDHTHGPAYIGLGQVYSEKGEMVEAESLFSKALEIDETSLSARLGIVQIRKTEKKDENLTALEVEATKLTSMPETRALSLHFALGKCYDDIKDYDRAISHFIEGCRLKRKRITYSSEETAAQFESIKSIIDSDFIKKFCDAGNDSKRPLFILGMPRSGTTLCEQILASHSEVYGGGEIPDFLNIANQFDAMGGGAGYPHGLISVDRDHLKHMGEKYLSGLKRRNETAKHVTDKMPANFLALGLIHVLLPNAKIIHMRRNPVDTCISNISKLFRQGQFQSYDLVELGMYYRNYLDLMEHWRHILPENAFLDVKYENLVADNDAQVSRILDFCDLEWHDACLSFYENKRSVRTASLAQVRKPLYSSSVGRWKRYEKYIQPLLDQLGEVVDEYDAN